MKFISIPKNGSAWSGDLVYVIDTESPEGLDLEVVINDVDHDVELGRCHLYNITATELNIAPYIRSTDNFVQLGSWIPSAFISPASRSIDVTVNGLNSDTRVFYRVPLDYDEDHTLSTISTTQTISLGEPIRLTAFGRDGLQIELEYYSSTKYLGTTLIDEPSYGNPLEIIIPTTELPKETHRIQLLIRSAEERILQRVVYCVVERTPSARRLMWYNSLGGVECYTFPSCVRSRYRADCSNFVTLDGVTTEQISRRIYYHLTSAYEVEAEMNRLAEIVFSPRIYELRDNDIVEVELSSREVAFDKHGALRQMSIEICEKGGVVC
ncbi:MAG: hypothetical protein J6R38_04530 [Alistipes sp.]|nr:hypothetical protein [Alistipes sp.]